MSYSNSKEAEKVLQVALGLDQYMHKDGEYLGITVREQHSHQSAWRSKPTGKYYVTMNPLHQGRRERDKMFKTKISLNNEFDIDEIKAYVKELVEARAKAKTAAATEREIKTANSIRTERVKAAYKGKRYISDYNSSHGGCSLVPSSAQENAINVRWDMTLDEETAMKFIEFINSIGK